MSFSTTATLLLGTLAVFAFQPSALAFQTTINSNMVLVINGKKVFPIGFTMPPPADAKAPNSKNAIRELAEAGATFLRTGSGHWNSKSLVCEEKWEDAAARYGMHCLVYLGNLASIAPHDNAKEMELRKLVERFKNHPGFGAWKGADEPEWGSNSIPPLVHAREIIRELDPNHPVVIIQAPRGTVETMRPYNVAGDIVGADVYPISYPPGTHSLRANKNISMVGDYTKIMLDVAEGKMPVWMVLQISWSGVLKPGKTLRLPTFPEERFMTYQAIINGARGLIYFGGDNVEAMSPQDVKLGWNWTFWQRVLRPVVEEIGSKSPLYPALLAPNSQLPIKLSGADDVEFCVREAGKELFILACKRESATVRVEFAGLPPSAARGEVMFESPRTVKASGGKFTDWFAPNDVHVYRFGR